LEVVNLKILKRAVGWCETVDNTIELVQGVAKVKILAGEEPLCK